MKLYIKSSSKPIAPIRMATDVRTRTKGLLGQESSPEVLVLERATWIHTFGMRFAIDVGYVDQNDRIMALTTMKPWRLGLPRLKSKRVLETAAGNFAEWGLKVGDEIEMKM